MVKLFIFLCLSSRILCATVNVCSFSEGEFSLRVPAGKSTERTKFIRQNSTFTETVHYIEQPFIKAWNDNNVKEIIALHQQWGLMIDLLN